MKGKSIVLSVAIVLGMGLEKSSATVPFLLTIDVSNPSAVTINATGLNSIANDSGRTANDGVDLLGFFTQNEIDMPAGQFLSGSTLKGGNLTLSYNDLWSDNYSTGDNNFYDLSMYIDINSPGSSDSQSFSTSQPAFSGSWTVNFSDLGINPSALPTTGSSGLILSGSSANPGSVIGGWQIASVPEPGTGSLVLLTSAVGLVFWRRAARGSTARR